MRPRMALQLWMVVALASVIFPITLRGQTNSWIYNTSGIWDIGSNWSLGVPPAVTQSAIVITNTNYKIVQIDEQTPAATLTVSNLTVGAPVGIVNTIQTFAPFAGPLTILSSFTISAGGALIWDSGSLQVNGVGGGQFRNDGTMVLNAGTLTSTSALFVLGSSATGTVWITGAGMTADNGTVIAGKGRITQSNGTWRVSGAYIGMYGGSYGTVAIAGGTNWQRSFLSLGYGATNATGILWLTGGQLIATNAPTRIGDGGLGQMTVSNGTYLAQEVDVGKGAGASGALTLAGGTNTILTLLSVGDTVGATGSVWLTGGLLTNETPTRIGNAGVGDMTVSNGTWQGGMVYVGYSDGARGTLRMAGGTMTLGDELHVGELAGSTGTVWLTGGQLATSVSMVGMGGLGQMTVSNGLWRPRFIFAGYYPGAEGTVWLAGGTNTLSDSFYVGYHEMATGTVWMTGGFLTVTNETSFIGHTGTGQMIVSNGTWRASGVYVGQNAGSRGTLTVAGGNHTLNWALMPGVLSGATGTVWLTGGLLNLTNATTTVGYQGVGRLVTTGGQLLAGDIIVASNSTASGTFTITGGTNTVNGQLLIGYAAGASGTMWLKGGQLLTPDYTTYIGRYGLGQMTISNGTWSGHSITVGRDTNSDGKLAVAGGNTKLTANLTVAMAGGSTGTVWMTGGGLTVTNFMSTIGDAGVGQMTVSNGLWQAADVYVGSLAGGAGTLNIAGGTNLVRQALYCGNVGCAGTGTITVSGGWTMVTNVSGTALLEVRCGTLVQRGGQFVIDRIVATNGIVQINCKAGAATFKSSNVNTEENMLGVGSQPGNTATLTLAGTRHLITDLTVGDGGGTGTVWMTAASLTVPNGMIFLGNTGRGTMTVSNGTVNTPRIVVAANAGQGLLSLPGGNTSVTRELRVGWTGCSALGIISITGGSLYVTNATQDAFLDVVSGTVNLASGLLQADRLVITNACAQFIRSGGTLIVGTLVLDPAQDTDGDLLPNWWEQQYGLDPLSGTGDDGWGGDADGDGMTNFQEYQAGTIPTVHITGINGEGANIRIHWNTWGRTTNRVQAVSGNYTNNFSDLSPQLIIPGSGRVTTNWVEIGGVTNVPTRYYRLRLIP